MEIRDLRVGYGDLEILHGVTLTVNDGEFAALVGANGAGKTTLMNAVSGVLKPRGGEISFEGQPIHNLLPHRIVELGLVQVPEGRHVFPRLSVLDNLLMGAYARRGRASRKDSLEFVFSLFPRLKERVAQLAGTLSGGEQQMVAIGRALMAKPRLLMLDEPSQGLAPVLVQQLLAAIKTINEAGCTILLVEQNVEEALRLAERGYVLQTGRIAMEGTGLSLLADEGFREAYFGLEKRA